MDKKEQKREERERERGGGGRERKRARARELAKIYRNMKQFNFKIHICMAYV